MAVKKKHLKFQLDLELRLCLDTSDFYGSLLVIRRRLPSQLESLCLVGLCLLGRHF